MQQTKARENPITEGVIWKQLLKFFFPIALGTFFQQLYNTVDAMVVGRFVGKEALAAVGSTGALIDMLIGFFVGLSSGATVVISQHYGAKREGEVSDAVHTSIALCAVGGLVLMTIGILIAPWALRRMSVPEEILPDAILYIRVFLTGVLPWLVYNMGSGILRAIGDSRRPLYFLIIGCLFNIAMDLLLVVGLKMGVAGAAAASALSQVMSAALVLTVLARTRDCYRLYPRKIRFVPGMLRSIARIGLPTGLQSAMFNISNLIIHSTVNGFGTDTVAAWAAYAKLDALYWMVSAALGVSITTFVGQNFGARRLERIRKCVRVGLFMGFGSALFFSGIMQVIGRAALGIFNTDPDVIGIGMQMVRLLMPFYFSYVCTEVLSSTLRGTGEAAAPFVITCVGICVLRLIWIFTVVARWHTLRMSLLSYPITWVITSVAFIAYYLRSGWLRRRCLAAGYGPME